MTWTAHEKGFNATPEQLTDKFSKFYRVHPEQIDLNIVEVWQKIEDQPKMNLGAEGQGRDMEECSHGIFERPNGGCNREKRSNLDLWKVISGV